MNVSQYIAVLGALMRHDLCYATGADDQNVLLHFR